MKNTILSVAIPAYNRTEILRTNLSAMLPELKRFSIGVYVSDDSSDDSTRCMLDELRQEYEHIYYERNYPALGHDRNIVRTLGLPDTDYVWLLGDSIEIEGGIIAKVLSVIERSRPEIVAVNARNRNLDVRSGCYDDANTILGTFGWHMTLTGAAIYSRAAANAASQIDFGSFKNFPQFALTFTRLAVAPSFCWINDVALTRKVPALTAGSSYWLRSMFPVFIDDWSAAVNALPDLYRTNVKATAIREHSLQSRLFGWQSLLVARSSGGYDLRTYREYKDRLAIHSDLDRFALILLAVLPKGIILAARRARTRIIKKRRAPV